MIYDEDLDGNLDLEPTQIYIMKRSGERVLFDSTKIAQAIRKANLEEGILSERLTEAQIDEITAGIEKDARNV
jgi:ribonucleoside-triphosphate reductase